MYDLKSYSEYYWLVFTKSVNRNFRAFWFVPVTWNILGYSLFCDCSQDGVSFQDIFVTQYSSDKWRSRTNKYQKRVELRLFAVYMLNLAENRKNTLDRLREMFVNCKMIRPIRIANDVFSRVRKMIRPVRSHRGVWVSRQNSRLLLQLAAPLRTHSTRKVYSKSISR